MNKEAETFLRNLNKKYAKLHTKYEKLFWVSYMGERGVDVDKDRALADRDAFRSDENNIQKINELLPYVSNKNKDRLKQWLRFFEGYQTPKQAISLKTKIDVLESKINKNRSERKQGYIDPKTEKFVEASSSKLSAMIATHPDEMIRKACFESLEKMATLDIEDYIALISLRNEYARQLGYEDFYDYKVRREDGMTKQELFSLFESIHEKTLFARKNIRDLEKNSKNLKGLRKPWNFAYLLAGDFKKEEDPYFQFSDALNRWGRSFFELGINFRGAALKLDLLDRKGKWSNGFCHWPELVRYDGKKRIAGSSNFTCNVVPNQIGSGEQGYTTLFHEGGHAAHLLNTEQIDVCLNHEYYPMSASWAETHSMFIDAIFSSIEWRVRYAKNSDGQIYPFDLYERRLKKLIALKPLEINSIIFVSSFEKTIYEAKNLTPRKVEEIARKTYLKFYDRTESSLLALNVPHIYSWESSASYHGYGLATLALYQWREYFLKKYGYIVDNKKVGEEMKRVWKLGSSKTFNECVQVATGKKLSANAFLKQATAPLEIILKDAKKRILVLEKIKQSNKPINLNAKIDMVHGKQKIADNKKSFEDMAKKYAVWLKKQVS